MLFRSIVRGPKCQSEPLGVSGGGVRTRGFYCDVVSHFGAGFGAHMTWRCLSQKVPLESLLNSPELWSICGDR